MSLPQILEPKLTAQMFELDGSVFQTCEQGEVTELQP